MSGNQYRQPKLPRATTLLAHVRRRPFTIVGLVTIVVLAITTGALSSPILSHEWAREFAFGPGQDFASNLASLVTGAWFAISPWCYLAVLASFGIAIGYAEPRLGTRKTVALWAATQLGSVLAADWVIDVFGPDGLRTAIDVGPSGGALAVAAVASGLMSTGWRRTVRFGLSAYAIGSFLLITHLADVVHLIAVASGLVISGWLIPRRDAPRSDAARRKAIGLLRTHGGGTLSWMTTWAGLNYLIDPRGEGYVAYRRVLGVALTVGDPVGSADWQRRAPRVFAAHCDRARLVPAYLGVGHDTRARLGGRHLRIGQDSVVELPGLAFRGKRWQDIRTARNRAARAGIRFELLPLAEISPATLRGIREIDAQWRGSKPIPELGFTLGGLTEAADPRVRVAVAIGDDGTVHGFTTWLPMYAPGGGVRGWTLDAMRRRTPDSTCAEGGGFKSVMEFLIAESAMAFQAEGCERLSLSASPLAGRTQTGANTAEASSDSRLQRGLERAGRRLEPLYGFDSLHAFKKKFSPQFTPMYLAYRHPWELPWVGAAVLAAYLTKPRKSDTASRDYYRVPRLSTSMREHSIRKAAA